MSEGKEHSLSDQTCLCNATLLFSNTNLDVQS